MKAYTVRITETVVYERVVEAPDAKDAEASAIDEHCNDDTVEQTLIQVVKREAKVITTPFA